MSDIIFAEGLFYNLPSDKAPDFIKANISIAPEKFIEWLQQQTANDKGYVKLTVKESKNGKVYVALDTWQPNQQQQPQQPAQQQPTSLSDDINNGVVAGESDDIPF